MAKAINSPGVEKVLDGYDVSTNGFAGAPVSGNGVWLMGYGSQAITVQAVSSGSVVGTLDVEASLNGVNWSSVVTSGDPKLAVNAASDPSNMVNFFGFAMKYFRIKFTRTSGSGTLSVWVSST